MLRSHAMALLVVTALATSLAAADAAARPKQRRVRTARATPPPPVSTCTNVVRWTSDAMLPLAYVRGSTIERNQGQCVDRDDTRWTAIDRWGRAVGVARHVFDPKTGDMMRVSSGSHGTNVFVSPHAPRATAEWSPDAAVRRELHQSLHVSSPREVLFFRSTHAGARTKRHELAVVVEAHRVWIAEHKNQRWGRLHTETAAATRWPSYSVRAIVDMNGDDMPEVIVHFSEDAEGHGHEIVLGARADGTSWKRLADNEDTGP